MLINRKEYQNYLDNALIGNGFPWLEMDTSRAKDYTDEQLLGYITQLDTIKCSGFGLIAELCKRFNTNCGSKEGKAN